MKIEKMKNKKASDASFSDEEKEGFISRLLQLVGQRNIRTAAKDWDLPYSTLNNYINKGTSPSLKYMQIVANKENVSLDWLANGDKNFKFETPDAHYDDIELRHSWNLVFNSLNLCEVDKLIKLIHRKGIERLLTMAHEKQDIKDVIDKLHIRSSLKQAIKMALAGDESTDKEILQCITTLISQEKN